MLFRIEVLLTTAITQLDLWYLILNNYEKDYKAFILFIACFIADFLNFV